MIKKKIDINNEDILGIKKNISSKYEEMGNRFGNVD